MAEGAGRSAPATPGLDEGATSSSRFALGIVLTVTGAFALVQLVLQDTPPSVLPWAAAAALLLGLLGVRLALSPDVVPRGAVHVATHGLIGVGVCSFALLTAWIPGRPAWGVALTLPVLWGLFFRLPGAVIGTTVAAATIVGVAAVADAYWQVSTPGTTVLAEVSIAVVLGLLCGMWAHRTAALREAAVRERRAAEAVAERERELAARLEELAELRTAFVAATSHELRTPLTTIAGFAATLQRPDVVLGDDRTQQMLRAIDRAADRLTRLIDDLREAAVPDVEATPAVELRAVAVRAVAAEVAETVGEGRTTIDGDATARVVADPGRLFQVLANLVANAMRHGAEHAAISWEQRNGRVHVQVSDDGPGIPEADRERIFERFERGSEVVASGHGLGLAIARDLCERMDGELELAPPGDGGGATFTVRLPAAPAEPARPRDLTADATA